MENDNHPGIQTLQIAACIVIVAYGLRMVSHILSILLLSLLLTYSIIPFPQWLIRRFHFHRGIALACTILLVISFYCGQTFALVIEVSHSSLNSCPGIAALPPVSSGQARVPAKSQSQRA